MTILEDKLKELTEMQENKKHNKLLQFKRKEVVVETTTVE